LFVRIVFVDHVLIEPIYKGYIKIA